MKPGLKIALQALDFKRIIGIILTVSMVLLSIKYIFHLRLFEDAFVGLAYFYLLMATGLSLCFIYYPATKGGRINGRMPWYDILAAVIGFGIPFYLFFHALDIAILGWESDAAAPKYVQIMVLALPIIIFEAVRRSSGLFLAMVCIFFGAFPLFSGHMPGFLKGLQYGFWRTVSFHAMGDESLLGIPMRVIGTIYIGFILFAEALNATGGGRFFLNIALALFGRFRGGPAKVAVVASGFFGSISGSAVANVLTTGSFTIPAMKRTGFAPHYAGAVEACASTGGVLMPPVMGATAFVMASFLGITYAQVCIAAALPSILYYFSLFVSVDAYAAKSGLKGLPRESIPTLLQTWKEGWFYLIALVVLIYLLVWEQMEGQAPFYGTALLLVLSMAKKEARLTLSAVAGLIEETGKLLGYLIALCCGIGLIIGSLSMTGVAYAFSSEILHLVGHNTVLLLIFSAGVSMILGMGMTITACYVFLALVTAPILVDMGLDPVASHLFILYWGMISYITPPVAVASYAAAGLAGSSPSKTGYQAMRLGMAIYILPFFFVLNPALICHGKFIEIVFAFFTSLIGLYILAGSLSRYSPGIGKIGVGTSILLFISGLLLAIPELKTSIVGIILAFLIYGNHFVFRRGKEVKSSYNDQTGKL